jgi:two-component system sensor histidine kinase/response regulator
MLNPEKRPPVQQNVMQSTAPEGSQAVPKQIRDRFFDKFVTHGKRDGTGLGTYSARLLTEAQNGRIHLQVSDSEDTTIITVHLPKA